MTPLARNQQEIESAIMQYEAMACQDCKMQATAGTVLKSTLKAASYNIYIPSYDWFVESCMAWAHQTSAYTCKCTHESPADMNKQIHQTSFSQLRADQMPHPHPLTFLPPMKLNSLVSSPNTIGRHPQNRILNRKVWPLLDAKQLSCMSIMKNHAWLGGEQFI